MKKILLFALLLTIGFTADVFAQGRQDNPPPDRESFAKDPAARVAKRVESLTEALKLSPEQVTEVTAIFTKGAEQMNALRTSGERAEARAQVQRLRDEQDAEIEAILDKKQLKRYLNYKARRSERGGRGGGRHGGGQPRPVGGS